MPRLVDVFLLTRPWSFPMTVMCVGSGIAYGFWLTGHIDVLPSILALVGSVLLHATANVWNDYFDYKYDIDRQGVGTTVYGPHPVVAGILTPKQTLAFGTALELAAFGIGVALTLAGKLLVVPLGFAGLVLAYAYTGRLSSLSTEGLAS